jgi:hypothetical protein
VFGGRAAKLKSSNIPSEARGKPRSFTRTGWGYYRAEAQIELGYTVLLIVIPLAWLAISVLFVCLCRMAAMSDAPGSEAARSRQPVHREMFVLEYVPVTTRASRRLSDRGSSLPVRQANAQRRRLANHPGS